MSRRIDEEEVVRLLRHVGRDVELDVSRIVDIIDGSTQTGSSRRALARAAPFRAARPGRPGEEALRWRGPRRLLAVPLAAVLAGGVFVTVHAAVGPGPGQVQVSRPPEASTATTPAPDATLGDAKSITAAPVPPASPRRPGSEPGPGTQDPALGAALTVTPVSVGTPYRMPLRDSREWLLVGSSPEGEQQRVPAGGSALGPAQSMGSGQAVSASPFALSWEAAGGTPSGKSRRWMTAPSAVRGAPAGLRIPVRVSRTAGTITLLTGTVGGGGKVTADVSGSGGPGAVLSQRFPECSGDAVCPAVVTITLDREHVGARGVEVMIELSSSGTGARVGLAAVELD